MGQVKEHAAQKRMTNKLILCTPIHSLIAANIEKTYDARPLWNLFYCIKDNINKGKSQRFEKALQESKRTIEQAFYETCDSLFDVQLTTDYEEGEQTIDNIFEQQRNSAFNLEDRKKL